MWYVNEGVLGSNPNGYTMVDFKNNKHIGEIGERIAIGELSKFGLDILLPMSDNLPYDFVVFTNNTFYKCQVKSTNGRGKNESFRFNLTSNNWNKGIEYKYSEDEIDIIICCDLTNIYLFKFSELKDKKNIYIRDTETKNNQKKGIIFAKDCILSEKRINEIFT